MTQATVSNRLSPAYRHWQRNLSLKQQGKNLEQIHDGDPRCGFYRAKRRGEWVAAFIRHDASGQLICRIGDEMADPVLVWADVASEPIEQAACETWFATGRWPGVEAKPAQQETGEVSAEATPVGAQASPVSTAAPAPMGHNAPPADVVSEMAEALDGLRAWIRRVGNKLADEEQVQIATNKVGTIRDLVSKAKKAHTVEKAPHWEACKAVDAKYNPSIKKCDEAGEYLRRMIADFKARELAAAEAERRKIEEAHAKKVAAAEKKGKAPPPPPAIATPEPQTKIHSDTGRALSFRQEAVLEIDDIGALFDRYQNYPEVAELFLKLARRDWKENGTAPVGTKIVQVAKVA